MSLTVRIIIFSFFAIISSSVESKVWFISPFGDDKHSGQTPDDALRNIQHGLNKAHAGDTVLLLAGKYAQDFKTVRNGFNGNEIQIRAIGEVTVIGAGSAHIVDINHNFIHLEGFTLDGLVGSGKKSSDYRDKLIYIKGDFKKGITGIEISHMILRNAFGECIRMRYNAFENEISHNQITRCGVRDFVFDRGQNNGESIYIGSSPEQLIKEKISSKLVDHSNENWIHHNQIVSYGSECVDIKEGSNLNLVEHNLCTAQLDPNVGGISVRGNMNIIKDNIIFNTQGAGIRLGGNTSKDGIYNTVQGNYLYHNKAGSIKIMRNPQKRICFNQIFQPDNFQKIRVKKGLNIDLDKLCNIE
ncbi:MAG: hypothetical protein ABGX51_02950 [Gammaproteobacteria bacterium]